LVRFVREEDRVHVLAINLKLVRRLVERGTDALIDNVDTREGGIHLVEDEDSPNGFLLCMPHSIRKDAK
jgi:hypothetical protein